MAQAPTSDPEAYDLYLKARLARENLNGSFPVESWQKVESLLSQAIARDANFELAYLERANVDLWLFMANHDTSGKTLDSARADLDRARKLAPDLPAVLAVQGLWAYAHIDYAQALELFQAAEQAGLNDADLLQWQATVLGQMGRYDEAFAIYDRLLALDPGNPWLLTFAWFVNVGAHKPVDAVRITALGHARAPESQIWLLLRTLVRVNFAGKLDEYFEVVTPAAMASSDYDIVLYSNVAYGILLRRYAETLKEIDGAKKDALRTSLIGITPTIALGSVPLALYRGQIDLILGDKASAEKDGNKVLDFVAHEKETAWNRWFLRLIGAEGYAMLGERSARCAKRATGLPSPCNPRT